MLDSILNETVKALNAGGYFAFREFPQRGMVKDRVSVVASAQGCRCISSSMGEYLGEKTSAAGAVTELFGRRLELTLVFEIYSPFELGAAACMQSVDGLWAALSTIPEGLRAHEMDCGEVTAEEEISSFRCVCKVRCTAFLVAEDTDEKNEFLDFVLKGVIDSADK